MSDESVFDADPSADVEEIEQVVLDEPTWERPPDGVEPLPPTPNGPPVLDAHDLVAGYIPEVNILNGCNLTVNPGEFVGIIGPNGAGKSTLLKAILGQCSVRSGTIRLGSEDITGRKAHELVAMGIGYVPQMRNVFPSLTVRENLEMGCYLAPRMFDDRYEYVTTLFPRLSERATQRTGALSGGERQMVAMGRALMMDPKVLLLDEPSAGLSPVLQDEVFVRCRRINQEGVAILMVEQNARRCLQVVHRGYVLDQGQNAYTGTGRALLSDPNVIELYLGTLAKASGG
jgi:branched-chain amino acid transport system ATP-binding protein